MSTIAEVKPPRICPKCGSGYREPPPVRNFMDGLSRLFQSDSLGKYGPPWTPFKDMRFDGEQVTFRCVLCSYTHRIRSEE